MTFSVFENALNYWFVAVSVLRIVIGIITIILAKRALGKERFENTQIFTSLGLVPGKFFSFVFGFIMLICGVLLIIGLFTQVAALAITILSLALVLLRLTGRVLSKESNLFFVMLATVCFSLIYFGAGAIALDLPL